MENIKELLANREIYTVTKGTSIKDAVFYMADRGVGLIPIMDDGKLVGVFSERDLVKRVIAKNKSLVDTKVEDVMSSNLIVAHTDEANESVLAKMKEAKIRHILIIENEKLIGVLSMRDLLELDLSVCKTTVEVLNNYIYSK
ncbi:MAG: CBS domain-containing protein [Ignavibacteriaceae bacterium]|nr:CBS domain-containing protein [Ignavibacteriaceae bacterium]